MYVSDQTNNRVQVFAADGTHVTQWGKFGVGDGQFGGIQRLAVGPSGAVYVCDHNTARVQCSTSGGAYRFQWGSLGSGDLQFKEPSGISVDATGAVYVADRANYRVQKFTPSGGYLAKWGTQGSGAMQFKDLTGIAVGPSGSVFTCDGGNSRITEFSADRVVLKQWQSPCTGSDPGPFAIAVDRSGRIYVVYSSSYQRILVFSPDGALLSQWDVAGAGALWDIAVDAAGDVYVADWQNCWVRVYGPITVSRDTTPPATTVSGIDKQWHNRPVKLSFTATDNAGGSGVAYTEAHLQDWLLPIWEPWARVEGGVFVVPASAEHADDGDRLLEYRSVDKAGIVEAAKQVTVLIDTRAPNVKVQPATATRNRRVVVKFRAQDQLSPDLRFEGSVFRESEDPAASTASVHYASSAWLPRKKLHTWSFTCRLEPGKYSVYVWARDRAGNEGMGKAALAVTND